MELGIPIISLVRTRGIKYKHNYCHCVFQGGKIVRNAKDSELGVERRYDMALERSGPHYVRYFVSSEGCVFCQ